MDLFSKTNNNQPLWELIPEKEKKLILYIRTSIKEVYAKDIELLKPRTEIIKNTRPASERSIVFRFGHYLQSYLEQDDVFSEYNLDCEYNRNMGEIKILPSFKNGTAPDLILHKRNSNDFNLMVMEFKGYWNVNQKRDFQKLIEFTDKAGTYKFDIGFAVVFGRTYNETKIDIFKNGMKIEQLRYVRSRRS